MSDFIARPKIEVLSAADGDRRRSWSDHDKLRIVEESCNRSIVTAVIWP